MTGDPLPTGDPPVVGAAGPLLSLAGCPWAGVTAAGRRLPAAVLVGGFLVASVTLSALLQAAAFTAVAAPGRRHQMDTPEELDASGMRVCPPTPDSADIFDNLDGRVWRSLSRKTWQCANEPGWDVNLINLETGPAKLMADQAWRRRPRDYDEVMHVMGSYSWSYLETYSVPRGSVFLEAFSRLTAQVVESGLANKWLDDRLDWIAKSWRPMSAAKELPTDTRRQELRPLTLSQMAAAGFVLGAGYLLSAVVFLLELACKKFTIKHPH